MTSLKTLTIFATLSSSYSGPAYSELLRGDDSKYYQSCLDFFSCEPFFTNIKTMTISESQFLYVLKLFEKDFLNIDKNDPSKKEKVIFYLHKQFVNYTALNICFERSKEYSFDKATSLFQGHFEALQKNGYEINSKYTRAAHTPLGLATQTSMPAICQALINIKADVYDSWKSERGVHSNLAIGIGYSYCLKKEDRLKCLQILLSHGCDPNSDRAANGIIGKTPPMILVAHRLENDIIQMLADAAVDINIFDAFRVSTEKTVKTTPLLAAIVSNVTSSTFGSQVSTINLLVNLKADLFVRNEEGEFADEVARKSKKPELAQYLLTLQISQIRKILEELNKYLASVLSNIVIDYVVYPSRFTFIKEMLNPPVLD